MMPSEVTVTPEMLAFADDLAAVAYAAVLTHRLAKKRLAELGRPTTDFRAVFWRSPDPKLRWSAAMCPYVLVVDNEVVAVFVDDSIPLDAYAGGYAYHIGSPGSLTPTQALTAACKAAGISLL